MLKKILYLVCFILITYSSSALAFPNEPNGFRDLYWGETLQDVKNSGYIVVYDSYNARYNSVRYYTSLDNPYISSYKSDTLCLDFWNNQLTSITIIFNLIDKNNVTYNEMLDALKTQFGYTYYQKNEMISWIGDTTIISMYQLKNSNVIVVNLSNFDLILKSSQDGASKGW